MKKEFTITVYGENQIGLLNRIAIIFVRRKINIDTMNTSPSEIVGIHRFTILIDETEEVVRKVCRQIEKQVDVLRQAHLVKIYNIMLNIIKQMLKDGVDPEMLASTLVAQGLRLYRGVLEEKAFEETIQVIVNNSKNMGIKPLFEEEPPKEKKGDTIN
jgi:acetolactate synthase small subunit